MSMNTKNIYGFSLIELITATAIIVILVTLATTAAYNARLRSYKTQAYTEAQQLAAAFRSYRIANKDWPLGFGSYYTQLTTNNLHAIMGTGSTDRHIYIEIPPERFEDSKLVDPWGNAYEVQLSPPEEVNVLETYKVMVIFQNSERYIYQN